MKTQTTQDQEFCFMILERLEQNLATPLRHIFEDNDDPIFIRREVRKAIQIAVEKKAETELPTEDWPNAGQIEHFKSFMDADINLFPSIAVSEHNFSVIQAYSGEAIHDYVKTIMNGLSLIKDGESAGVIAAQIAGTGLLGFGAKMIWAIIKALRAGSAIRAAMITGIRAMGSVSLIIGVAGVIITELLIYLVVNNQKAFLGMVFNNTDLNLQVANWRAGIAGEDSGDLYMNTGKIVAFVESNEDENLDSPKVQIPSRVFIAPNDPDNVVMCGMFAAEKNTGLYGTEGVMVLTDKEGKTNTRFFLQFACPYIQANGVNVLVDTGAARKAKEVFNDLYDQRGLDKISSAAGYTFHVRCHSTSGGEAAGIATLSLS